MANTGNNPKDETTQKNGNAPKKGFPRPKRTKPLTKEWQPMNTCDYCGENREALWSNDEMRYLCDSCSTKLGKKLLQKIANGEIDLSTLCIIAAIIGGLGFGGYELVSLLALIF